MSERQAEEEVDNPQPPDEASTSASDALQSANPRKSSGIRIDGFFRQLMPPMKAKLVNIQVLEMIVKAFQSFSVVENSEFRKLCQMLHPGFTLPSRKTSTRVLLSQIYEIKVEQPPLASQSAQPPLESQPRSAADAEPINPPIPELRRSSRARKPPRRLNLWYVYLRINFVFSFIFSYKVYNYSLSRSLDLK